MKDEVIVVAGLPRSGTSMMMKMLDAGGLPVMTDDIRTPDEDNPRGYYEFEAVKGIQGDTSWLQNARGRAVKMVSALLRYLPADYSYKVIFMQREMHEILASQRKMLARRAADAGDRDEAPAEVDDAHMAILFEEHLKTVCGWLKERPEIEVLYVNYNDVLQNPFSYAEQINGFLDAQLDVEAMASVVDPTLYRNRRSM